MSPVKFSTRFARINMDIVRDGDEEGGDQQADGDLPAATETNQAVEEAGAGTKKRNRMSMLTHSLWSAQCAELGPNFGSRVAQLNARAPADLDLAISFSLTIAFDVVEGSGKKQVLRRATTKHYVSSEDIMIKQRDDPGAACELMKIQLRKLHLLRPKKAEGERPDEHQEKEQPKMPVRETKDDLTTVRSLLNQHCHYEWGLEPGVLVCTMHAMHA